MMPSENPATSSLCRPAAGRSSQLSAQRRDKVRTAAGCVIGPIKQSSKITNPHTSAEKQAGWASALPSQQKMRYFGSELKPEPGSYLTSYSLSSPLKLLHNSASAAGITSFIELYLLPPPTESGEHEFISESLLSGLIVTGRPRRRPRPQPHCVSVTVTIGGKQSGVILLAISVVSKAL